MGCFTNQKRTRIWRAVKGVTMTFADHYQDIDRTLEELQSELEMAKLAIQEKDAEISLFKQALRLSDYTTSKETELAKFERDTLAEALQKVVNCCENVMPYELLAIAQKALAILKDRNA